MPMLTPRPWPCNKDEHRPASMHRPQPASFFYFLFSSFWLHWAFSRCSVWAWLLHGMWNLSRARTELMFPALGGGFLTTGPPGNAKNLEASQPCDRKTRAYRVALSSSHYIPTVTGRKLSLHSLQSSVLPKQLLHVRGLSRLTRGPPCLRSSECRFSLLPSTYAQGTQIQSNQGLPH